MPNNEDYLFDVPIERQVTSRSTVTVRARDKTEAKQVAEAKAHTGAYEPTMCKYEAGEPALRTNVQPPPPNLKEAYRDFVMKFASNHDSAVETLPPFEDWQRRMAAVSLVDFFHTYVGAECEALDEQVHELHANAASNVNNDGAAEQIEYLYENLGWEGTRKLLISMIPEQAEYVEYEEPESVHDEEYDYEHED